MDLLHKNLLGVFGLCFFLLLCHPLIPLYSPLTFFFPFFIICLYQKPLSQCLWLGFFGGIFFDLLLSDTFFGFFSLCTIVTLWGVNFLKKFFFSYSLSTLPLMTYFFGLIYSFFAFLFSRLLFGRPELSGKYLLIDFGFYPFLEALYAFTFFIFPFVLLTRIQTFVRFQRQKKAP